MYTFIHDIVDYVCPQASFHVERKFYSKGDACCFMDRLIKDYQGSSKGVYITITDDDNNVIRQYSKDAPGEHLQESMDELVMNIRD